MAGDGMNHGSWGDVPEDAPQNSRVAFGLIRPPTQSHSIGSRGRPDPVQPGGGPGIATRLSTSSGRRFPPVGGPAIGLWSASRLRRFLQIMGNNFGPPRITIICPRGRITVNHSLAQSSNSSARRRNAAWQSRIPPGNRNYAVLVALYIGSRTREPLRRRASEHAARGVSAIGTPGCTSCGIISCPGVNDDIGFFVGRGVRQGH